MAESIPIDHNNPLLKAMGDYVELEQPELEMEEEKVQQKHRQ